MTKPDFLKCECRHCAGHIEFPAGAAGETVACPHCGQPTSLAGAAGKTRKNPRRPLIFGITALLVAAAAAVGFTLIKKPGPAAVPAMAAPSATHQPVTVAASPGEITTNDFSLSAIRLEKTPGSSLVYVTGTVRNLSEKERYGVKVEFGLFDTNNAPDGQATDYHQILQPHDQWHFKALVMDSKAISAKLDAVSEVQ